MDKSDAAFRTIGEVSEELGVAQHVLRYWETRFRQLKPIQRAGNRRYYRPTDVELARRIHKLLNRDGYTVKGVQKLLSSRGGSEAAMASDATMMTTQEVSVVAMPATPAMQSPPAALPLEELRAIRALLADALAAD